MGVTRWMARVSARLVREGIEERKEDLAEKKTQLQAHQRARDVKLVHKAVGELDDRLGIARNGTSHVLNKIFPDHWSFFLGEIALYSFIVLVATGIFLTLYYVPSATQVVYHGRYTPLDGEKVSAAYNSVMDISFKVRAGLLMRQMHHWAANIFIGAIAVHMMRIFFTSAYRRPRDMNWTVGVTLLILSIFNGYLGYSLPNDLMAGSADRIGYSIILSIPFIGSYLAFFFFGGNWPGTAFIPRFFILHVLILPLAIIGLLGVHLLLIFRQEHTQWAKGPRREGNVVGQPMVPNFLAKTTGLMFTVAGVLAILGAVAQIDPIWTLGPYHPYVITYMAQPDWYLGFLEGALRIMPSWEWAGWGHTVPWNVFVPGVLTPLLIFSFFYSWPLLERRFTRDERNHNLLVEPRYRPVHTAIGVGAFMWLFMLFFDAADDVIANFFHISLNDTVWALRFATFVVPVLAGLIAYRICKDLQRLPALRTGRQVRLEMTPERYYEAKLDPAPRDGKKEPGPIEVPDAIEFPDPTTRSEGFAEEIVEP